MKGRLVAATCAAVALLLAILLLRSRPVGSQSSAEDPFSLANLLEVQILPVVEFHSDTGKFTFTYTITNSQKSLQKMDEINLTLGTRKGITNTLQPRGKTSWKPIIVKYDNLKTDLVTWFAEGKVYTNIRELFFPDPEAILPGESITGLGVEGKNLPGIRLDWTKGWVKPLGEKEIIDFVNEKKGTNFTNSGEIPNEIIFELIPQFRPDHENALQGKTVGPDILPDNLSNEQLLDRLISLKDQAFQLGWINHKGVAHSLNKKLEAAKKKLQQGKIKTVAHILHAFIHDLEAQHRKEKERDKEEAKEKHINDHAFFLLKPNAEFILFRLGALEKGKGKED